MHTYNCVYTRFRFVFLNFKAMKSNVKILFGLCLWCLLCPHFLQSKPSIPHKHLNDTKCISPEDISRKPVVMIPGILGSRLQGRMNRTKPSWPCKTHSNWEDLWLNLDYLLPYYVDCWVKDLKMVYNSTTRKSHNSPGVEVRAPFFGSTEGFEYLDQDQLAPGSKYFSPLVEYLVCNLGYTRSADLRGAPFDWRLPPYQQTQYFNNLTKLIEHTYYTNNNQKVVLIAHSLGTLFTYYMLQNQKQSWKDKFVESFVSISGPYMGAVKSLKALISGETEGHPYFLPRLKIREITRSGPAFTFLLPRPDMWPKDKRQVVVTLKKNYTVDDYEALFQTIGCEWCWDMFKDNIYTLGSLEPPSVAVHCIYGSQLPTTESLIYDEDLFPDEAPSLVDGSGDGTVNVWSGSSCLRWKGKQKQLVKGFEMPGNDHVQILWNSTLHKYLNGVLIR